MTVITETLKPAVDVILALPKAERKLEAQAAERQKLVKEANWQNDLTSTKLLVKFFIVIGIVFLVLVFIAWVTGRSGPKE
jgi:hypothetical protein